MVFDCYLRNDSLNLREIKVLYTLGLKFAQEL